MNSVIIPAGNPVLFLAKNRALLPQYHTKLAKDWPALETLKPWQGFGKYFQKWQTNDIISLQVFADIGPLALVLYSCKGAKVATLNFTRKQKNPRTASLFIYEASLSLQGIPKGRYRLEIQAGSPVLYTLESDWLDIAADWPHTVLLEYKNSFFYADTLFATGYSPTFRVEGWFKKKPPVSKDEVYIDQVYNARMLFSDPFTIYRFIIGPSSGVPDWTEEALNWYLGMDELYIDGYRFTKPEGAKFSENEEEGVPFRGLEIDLQPSARRSSSSFDVDGSAGGRKILVALNVETEGFADTTLGASSNVIQITKVNN